MIGHSHGGGIASAVAHKMAQSGIRNVFAITLGAPYFKWTDRRFRISSFGVGYLVCSVVLFCLAFRYFDFAYFFWFFSAVCACVGMVLGSYLFSQRSRNAILGFVGPKYEVPHSELSAVQVQYHNSSLRIFSRNDEAINALHVLSDEKRSSERTHIPEEELKLPLFVFSVLVCLHILGTLLFERIESFISAGVLDASGVSPNPLNVELYSAGVLFFLSTVFGAAVVKSEVLKWAGKACTWFAWERLVSLCYGRDKLQMFS